MTTSVPSTGGQPDPAASLAAIEDQERRTASALVPSPLGTFLAWGVAYLVGFGAAWLAVAPHAVLPPWAATVLLAVSLAGALVSNGVSIARSSRGVVGRSRRIGVMFGGSWLAGFAAITVVNGRLADLGVPASTMSLIWSASALLVVGLLYLASGTMLNAPFQYALGMWTLACAVAAVLAGYPANFLVLALAGGAGFVALGVGTHLRGRPRTA